MKVKSWQIKFYEILFVQAKSQNDEIIKHNTNPLKIIGLLISDKL